MITQHKYTIIDTLEKLQSIDAFLMEGENPRFRVLAYDTETTGLQLYKNTIVGVSFSVDKFTGFYIPLMVWEPDKNNKKVKTIKREKYDVYPDGKLRCIWTNRIFTEEVTPQEYDAQNSVPQVISFLEKWLTATNLYMWNAPFDVSMTNISLGFDLSHNLFLDGGLLVHVLDENYYVGLKPNTIKYKDALGIDPYAAANEEKKELDNSIIGNGGKSGMVWRADLRPQAKYACSDTNYTYGICEQALKDFQQEYGVDGLKWFFEDEVMPLCREVVCDMKQKGVFINVPHFEKLQKENEIKLHQLEDEIVATLTSEGYLKDFSMGKSLEEEISNKALVLELMRRENVEVPKKKNSSGEMKETIAKGDVKKYYQQDPHWIYGYILGENELKKSDSELDKIRLDLFKAKTGKRHQFNIGSVYHLRWLFIDKLGFDPKQLPQTNSATKDNPIPQMGAEVLEEYFLEPFPWVAKLISWKKLSKLQSTYINPALELNVDGWLYMDFKQNGTTSGRFAVSGGYNLQTLPSIDNEMETLSECQNCSGSNLTIQREIQCMADVICNDCGHETYDVSCPSSIKEGFVAPEGYKIVNADYPSLEPRCFAFVSGEEAIKDVYRNGEDLYSKFFIQIFDTEGKYSAHPNDDNYLKKVDPGKRKWMKPIALAIPYGAEAGQVAKLTDNYRMVEDSDGVMVRRPDYKEGDRIRTAYLEKLPSLRQYMTDREQDAQVRGYVTSLLGRKRHLPVCYTTNLVLSKNGTSFEGLLYGDRRKLSEPSTSYVCKEIGTSVEGQVVTLREEWLKEICELLGIPFSTAKEKGCWKWLRAYIKNELNNAKNNPIQALAGHIANRAMIDANRLFKQHGVDGRVFLQVHDEVGAYVKEEQAELGAQLLKQAMESNRVATMIDLPMIVEPAICDTLKEAK